MTSRVGERTLGVLAGSCVLILLMLIVLLWTGVGSGMFNTQHPKRYSGHRTGNASATNIPPDISGTSTPRVKQLSIEDNIDGREIEYVKPLKISSLPLHEEDRLYGPDQWLSSDEAADSDASPPLRHHSGHYRHKMAEVWDPHPQYQFTAFGKRFHLVLTHDSGFVHPELQVTHIWHNTTVREHPGLKPNGCFYTGHVVDDPHSTVAVSLCNGMTGLIHSSWGSFFIEPAEHWRDHMTPLLHALYRQHDSRQSTNHVQDTHPGPHCGVMDGDLLESSGRQRPPVFVGNRTKRSPAQNHTKRKLHPYYIEIMVVADRKMADYHGPGLNHYILSLMHTVDKFYKHASVGNPITVAVVKIMVANELSDNSTSGRKKLGTLAPDYLSKFCTWQSRQNNNNNDSREHYDTALLLTREHLCRSLDTQHNVPQGQDGPKCDTLGLAELGTMCSKHSSCSIVRDNGLSAAFTIAHELGHVLNMPHDDDERCRPFHSADKMTNVMSRMLDNNASPYSWSNCSRHFVTEFLDAGYGDCLHDEPFNNEVTDNMPRDWLPGQNFTEDKQCELANGKGSKICTYMPMCSSLWCGVGKNQEDGCTTNHMPWADGTPCGKSRWCQQGECVDKDKDALVPVNGKWGEWQPFGDCSRTCGGGVEKSVRFCDSPPNSNGGRYCLGKKVRYRSCNTQDCPAGSKDFREVQCAEHNGNNFKIHGLSSYVTWVPKYGGLGAKDRCMLYCRVSLTGDYYALRNQVMDGTQCGPDTYDMCVNGICRPAGCDHILDSDLKLDFCGKCGGDNSSCHWIEGSYNRSIYGYNEVVRIPAGSSNIDIRQTGQGGAKDENYLALVDSETGDYILNGRYSVTNYLKMIPYGGAKIQYSGSDAVVERLNTSRPVNKDLILEVLSVGKVNPPDIEYRYTAMRNDYHWELEEGWTECDKVCKGVRARLLLCVKNQTQLSVDHKYCSAHNKPRVETEPCNVYCNLKWQVWSESECSSHCGLGTKTRTVQCVQEMYLDGRILSVPDSSCDHLEHLRPADEEACEGPCHASHWMYGSWEQCSVTCGGGSQTRSALCVNDLEREVDRQLCDSSELILKQRCNTGNCPSWTLAHQWSPCTVTCGEGESTQAYYCELDGHMVSPSLCHSQPEPEHKKLCSMPPCHRYPQLSTSTTTSVIRGGDDVLSYGDDVVESNSIDDKRSAGGAVWRTGPWGECSRSCGGGFQRRQVRCRAEDHRDVEDSLCLPRERPRDTVHCNVVERCPSWSRGPWGECNKSCGVAYRYRQVACQSPAGQTLSDEACSADKRMPDTEQCRLPPCRGKNHRWKIGPWSTCSKSCGMGTRKRVVECVAPDGRCDANTRPKTVRNCKHMPCPNSWVVADWTECSVTCGVGVQHRSVVCNSLQRNSEARTDLCNGEPKPVESQPCQQPACDSLYYWSVADWQRCVPLYNGKRGHQIRRISCYHRRTGRKVPQLKCHKESKPKRKRKCNPRKLYAVSGSCLEVKQRKRTGDGEYPLSIHGQVVSLYCHGMNTETPTEYLTLANEEDNFAEIYDRRLLNPATCPDGGLRRDNCACVLDAEGKAGLTVYKRIRLNITSLKVNTYDTTFARQVKGRKVAYAEAGDCYSQVRCPQGRFSVDLRGTPFRVSASTSWKGHGSLPSMDVQRGERDQRVQGKCGGYCGSCSPHSHHGLTLDWLQPP